MMSWRAPLRRLPIGSRRPRGPATDLRITGAGRRAAVACSRHQKKRGKRMGLPHPGTSTPTVRVEG